MEAAEELVRHHALIQRVEVEVEAVPGVEVEPGAEVVIEEEMMMMIENGEDAIELSPQTWFL